MGVLGGNRGNMHHNLGQKLADLAWEVVIRKQFEAELSESEERFHKMFKNHDAVMLLIEPITGHIIEANDAAVAFYGYSREEFQALSIHDINTLSKDDVDAARNKALSGKQNSFEFKHQLSTGEIRDVEVHVSSVPMDKKMLLFSIIHDISQRKKLIQAQKRSAQLAAIGQLAANIAHEINNPTQAIIAFSELIEEQPGQEDFVLDITKRIKTEGLKIGDLVKTALHYSRKDAPVKKPDDINRILKHALSLLKGRMKKENVNLVFNQGENIPDIVVNSREVEQVIINLVSKSIDALESGNETEGEKRIHINTSKIEGKEEIQVVIYDNGEGIPETNMTQIKEAFFTTKEAGRGTGLGLSIVDDIMRTHGGVFELDSVEGEYTKAILTFPVTSPSDTGS